MRHPDVLAHVPTVLRIRLILWYDSTRYPALMLNYALRMRPGVLIGSRYTVVKVLLELLMRAYTLPSCNCPYQCCWGSLLWLLFPLLSYDYDLLLLTNGNRYRFQYT